MPHTKDFAITNEMRKCIEACTECHEICTETVQHCLTLGGAHAAPEHITTLLDCAQICQTSADFLTRGSEYHSSVCGVCAEVCRACETECRSMGNDQQMQKCADACAKCAESCEKMAGTRR
jgi:hypothetical protein